MSVLQNLYDLPVEPLREIVREQRFPLLFAAISGSHLYGFPSPDSDFDLRGVHVLPAIEVLGLRTGPETIESSGIKRGIEMDLVTHDAQKFFLMLLKPNGYVLEQLLSPLVIHSTPEHEELKSLVPACITRHHAHHYLGFSQTQWNLFEKESPPRVKPLLYVYRTLLTGIHLMRTGLIDANLIVLNEQFKLPQIGELVAAKLAGPEKATLSNDESAFHQSEFERLRAMLKQAAESTTLPTHPTAKPALHDLLLRLRMRSVTQ